jgi:hypothetical protein
MSLPLMNYKSIEIALLFKLTIEKYKVNPSDTPIQKILRYSTMHYPITFESDGTYLPLGNLMDLTDSQSNIRATSQQTTLTISGIPNNSIKEILNSGIKGSKIEIFRKYCDPTTGNKLENELPYTGRFKGIVNNYAITEDYNMTEMVATNTIQLTCSSVVDMLMTKMSGRRTNGTDQKAHFPTDVALDRVTKLSGSNFNFGAPTKK